MRSNPSTYSPRDIAVESIFPKSERRPIELELFATLLGQRIAEERGSSTAKDSIGAFGKRYGLALSKRHIAVAVEEIREALLSDRHYDSEDAMAVRAIYSSPTLMALFSDSIPEGTVELFGWLPGHSAVLRGERFTLTGQPCPRCRINPEAHGIGGGTRCVDTLNCGWGFCY